MDDDQNVDEDNGIDQDPAPWSRLDTEWATVIGIRDAMKIAAKASWDADTSYRGALALAAKLYPELCDPEVSLVQQRNLSETAQKYIQMADAKSLQSGSAVSAVDLMIAEASDLQGMIDAGRDGSAVVDQLRKERERITKALDELTEAKNSENALIFRDAFQVKRQLPGSGDGRSYRQFRLDKDRILRIRVLHPDKPEHATGVDMLYENYWDRGKETWARLAAVQYKLWAKDRVLRIDSRAERQLSKMERLLCASAERLCEDTATPSGTGRYRLPFCASFVRPSDELQPNDARLMSSGLYVPTCVVRRAMNSSAKKRRSIPSRDIRSEAVTQTVFEELFYCNLLGSRWIKADDLEKIYRVNNVIQPSERIVIHAQEYSAAR